MKRSLTSYVAIVLAILFTIAIVYIVVAAFKSNETISITHNEQSSPIVVDLYIEEGKPSPLLEGIIESSNVFADDMQKGIGDYSPWKRVPVEKGLIFRLRSIQIWYDWFYSMYPSYSEFCMKKFTISPQTEISDDRMVIASPGVLTSVERYEFVNGKTETELALDLTEEFKDGACPTPSGTILFSDEQTSQLGLIPLYAKRTSYYYPFDQQDMSFNVWIELSMKNQKGEEGIATITPEVKLSPLLQDWKVNAIVANNDLDQTIIPGYSLAPDLYNIFSRTTVKIEMTRPFVTKSFSVVVFMVALIIIISLAFLRDHGVVVGTAITIALGLWGVQNFILPAAVKGLTIMAPVIFALYGLLAVVLIVRFAVLFPKAKMKSNTATVSNSSTISKISDAPELETVLPKTKEKKERKKTVENKTKRREKKDKSEK